MNRADFPKRILIIDRHQSSITELTRILSREGYQVTAAPTGAEALEIITSKKFDAILCDLILPDGSGLDLLAKIKRLEPEALVVLMGNHITPGVVLESVSRGAYDILYKPFLSESIAGKLEHLLRKTPVWVQRVGS